MTARARRLSLVLLLVLGCGDITVVGPHGTLVGAACTADSQCQTSCLIDDRHFPGGMCTVPCASDAECPSGSACVAHMSGLCVLTCRAAADCAGLGRGYDCGTDERTTGGPVSVCLVP